MTTFNTLESSKSTIALYLQKKAGDTMNEINALERKHAEKLSMVQREHMILSSEWLRPNNTGYIYEDKSPGTCEWIWSTPEFVQWISSPSAPSRLLCVHGVNGCGKSMLARCTVREMREKKHQTLFFSFSGVDGDRKTLNSLARSLLYDLLVETSDEGIHSTVAALKGRNPMTTADLLAALLKSIESIGKPIYCVIDGVDECDDENNDQNRGLLKCVLDLVKLPNCHVALVGRPYALQTAVGLTPLIIEMNASMVKSDIERFIHDQLEKSPIPSAHGLKDEAVRTLCEKSDGMFLWVKFAIEDLREAILSVPTGVNWTSMLQLKELSQLPVLARWMQSRYTQSQRDNGAHSLPLEGLEMDEKLPHQRTLVLAITQFSLIPSTGPPR
ncbi:hypothetical protein BO94DRAFT_628644 [Aspergillus sclerotioniger CBS 115572]|uniref:NACHT domain-containing protein n=1 Tax=Aspergillus sclerotioniger CBS 115572 TaxID=1450535 RepID=A0A317V8X3_9EURO|nr:hypothetical protein BO94DRAFT_628644 [Aspergillus sclerotioniger CBS 115572]PWY68510.1 hypothetical protein BO94DRAFT_628644 [Aspergillus sclerotioniger CBS 115572]